jgi:galactosamine-6-phosphate isomerase
MSVSVFLRDRMHVRMFISSSQMADWAARRIVAQVSLKPDLVLCASVGHAPAMVYREMARMAEKVPYYFRYLRVVKPYEFLGKPTSRVDSCEAFLRKELLSPLGIDDRCCLGYKGDAPDPEAECRRVEDALDAWGGIEMAVLDSGVEGNLGFCERDLPPSMTSHITELTVDTGSLQGQDETAMPGYSLGIGDLLNAKDVLLLVCGEDRRDAFYRTVSEDISSECHATLLRIHESSQCLCDWDAARSSFSKLSGRCV